MTSSPKVQIVVVDQKKLTPSPRKSKKGILKEISSIQLKKMPIKPQSSVEFSEMSITKEKVKSKSYKKKRKKTKKVISNKRRKKVDNNKIKFIKHKRLLNHQEPTTHRTTPIITR